MLVALPQVQVRTWGAPPQITTRYSSQRAPNIHWRNLIFLLMICIVRFDGQCFVLLGRWHGPCTTQQLNRNRLTYPTRNQHLCTGAPKNFQQYTFQSHLKRSLHTHVTEHLQGLRVGGICIAVPVYIYGKPPGGKGKRESPRRRI
jgi:hypothetical protein